MSKKRVCYVVCYRDPNYTRTNSLINALSLIDAVDLLVIKNRHRGVLRYIEVPVRLLIARLRFKPDTFIVGFRAHEIFWALYPAMMGKKIVFDEFINLHDYLVNEHKKLRAKSLAIRLIDAYMRWVMRVSAYILTDTEAHAKLAIQNYRIHPKKAISIPVGADEKVFYPHKVKHPSKDKFEVFFYGTALPLHGIEVILDAAKEVAGKNQNIHFTLVGGRGNQKFISKLDDYIKANDLQKYIAHLHWAEYKKLPAMIAATDLCLGGPFGGTGQAKRVVSGKTYQFLAMGKATVIGVIEDMQDFKDKKNCLLVKQSSAKSLADAILWAADNKQNLPNLGQLGRELFENKFSSHALSTVLEDIL